MAVIAVYGLKFWKVLGLKMLKNNSMDEVFSTSWNVTKNKFTPSPLEWLCWIGQPMIYDGGLCVNRTTQEHSTSNQTRGVLIL